MGFNDLLKMMIDKDGSDDEDESNKF